MKKIRPRFLLFLLIGVFQANFSNAQLGSYVFTKDTATYITITGGTALGPTQSSSPVGPYSSYFFGNLANLDGSSNSAPLPGFPIGFNFVFDGNTFDRFIIGSDGWIKLGNSGQSISTCGGFTSINYMYSTMALSAISCATNIISIFRIDLSTWELVPQASGVGRLRYLLSGTSPSRKLIIQWEKFNLFHSWNAGEFYKVNFQLTLNEGTNSIQFHYGPMTNHYGISDSLGIEVGIKGLGQFNGLMCQADSSWDSTQVFLGTPAKCNLSPTVKPSNGLRFTLSPGSVCAGTPNAGVAISNLKYVCPSDNDTISLVGNDYGAGISYKWESSNDTLLWSPISGKINRFMVVNQSATKYYRCIVSCSSGSSDTSEFVKVTQKQAYLCSLCKGSTATCKFAGNTSPFNDIKIIGTSFHFNSTNSKYYDCQFSGSVSNNSTCFDPIDSNTANLIQGLSYVLNFTPGIKAYYPSIWADYNHDGLLSSGEFILLADSLMPFVSHNISFTIPSLAFNGFTEFRFMTSESRTEVITASGSCTSKSAWFGCDFIFTIGSQLPCVSPPTAGFVTINKNNLCASDNAIISLLGSSTGLGQTYNWQYSLDAINWLPTANNTNPNITPTHLADTIYYRCVLNCSGIDAYSNILKVYYKKSYLCYCYNNLGGSSCAASDFILKTELVGTALNNSDTLCNLQSGSNQSIFEASLNTTGVVSQLSSYKLLVTCSKSNTNVSAWIDYDHSGTFTTGEYIHFPNQTIAYVPDTTTFLVPSNALLGITGLRIRSHSLPGNNFSWAACTFSTFGEVEDYFVTIDLFNKVKEIETKEIKIIAYPNPASQQLTIKIDGTIKGNVRLKMLNINGKEVYTKEIFNLKNTDRILLNLSSYTEGIYILQLVYNEGVVMQKVIIE